MLHSAKHLASRFLFGMSIECIPTIILFKVICKWKDAAWCDALWQQCALCEYLLTILPKWVDKCDACPLVSNNWCVGHSMHSRIALQYHSVLYADGLDISMVSDVCFESWRRHRDAFVKMLEDEIARRGEQRV